MFNKTYVVPAIRFAPHASVQLVQIAYLAKLIFIYSQVQTHVLVAVRYFIYFYYKVGYVPNNSTWKCQPCVVCTSCFQTADTCLDCPSNMFLY